MAKHTKAFIKKLESYKVNFYVIVGFLIYLLAVPRLVIKTIPCLSEFANSASSYQNCTLILALDRFIILAIAGFLVSNAILIILKVKIKPLLITNIILVILIVTAYYAYIPVAWKAVNTSDVYLDTLLDDNI